MKSFHFIMTWIYSYADKLIKVKFTHYFYTSFLFASLISFCISKSLRGLERGTKAQSKYSNNFFQIPSPLLWFCGESLTTTILFDSIREKLNLQLQQHLSTAHFTTFDQTKSIKGLFQDLCSISVYESFLNSIAAVFALRAGFNVVLQAFSVVFLYFYCCEQIATWPQT